jgi:hypothetical protein
MDGPANTLTTQGAEGTEAGEPLREYPARRERLGEATSLSATQFGIMVRNAKRRDDRLMSMTRRGRELNEQQRRNREKRFRGYEQGENLSGF